MIDILDILETCLQEIENGADVDAVLRSHPHLAAELRPILNASLMARAHGAAVADPSPEAVRRGRAKVLQHAAQMREAKVAPRKRAIPIFQRLAIAFTLATLFLSSGTGLVRASSSALPGENLYPVKLTWENLRLFFAFNQGVRETLVHSFRNERLHEVNELLLSGRHETIQFAGIYMEVNGVTYVSGIRVTILDTSLLPPSTLQNGAAVIVNGHTNAQGFVDVDTIELLLDGTFVPVGEPVEVGTEDEANSHDKSGRQLDDDNDDNDNASAEGQNENSAGNETESPDDLDNRNENRSNDNVSNDDSNTNNSDNDKSDDNSGKSEDNSGSSGGDDNSGSGGGDDGGGGDDDGGGDDGSDDD